MTPLETLRFGGRIHLIQGDAELEGLKTTLSSVGLLGFDTETKPSFRKGEVYGVALVQLATADEAFLIRMQKVSTFTILKEIFENEQIVKVGVAIRDDLKQLQKIFPFAPAHFVELQTVAKSHNLKNMGLKGMTEEVLGATISKGAKITNWEASELTPQQILYAATDAWIGLRLYQALRARPTPDSQK